MTSCPVKVPIPFPSYIVDVGYTIILEKRRKRSIFLHEMKISCQYIVISEFVSPRLGGHIPP